MSRNRQKWEGILFARENVTNLSRGLGRDICGERARLDMPSRHATWCRSTCNQRSQTFTSSGWDSDAVVAAPLPTAPTTHVCRSSRSGLPAVVATPCHIFGAPSRGSGGRLSIRMWRARTGFCSIISLCGKHIVEFVVSISPLMLYIKAYGAAAWVSSRGLAGQACGCHPWRASLI